MKELMKNNNLVPLYTVIISLVALGMGFSDSILANYFADAYDATATQRGFIEFPRELPGVLAVFAIASLSRLGDIRITMVSQFLAFAGIMTLGLTTPEFYTMTFFLFIFSMGAHMYMPLVDSIAISISDSENMGAVLGRFKGISVGFSMIAAVIVFFGFRYDVFSFKTDIKWIFVLAALMFLAAAILLGVLSRKAKDLHRIPDKPRVFLKKKYKFYYVLAIMNGVQKQVFIVYAPWVIIQILHKETDTTAILLIISSICGVFFMPFLGRCIDRFGLKIMLYADAISFIVVYSIFGFLVYNLYVGNFSITGIAAFATFAIFVLDRMSSQMGIIRTLYLKSIAVV